ncbi:MAG: patatin-like phospholipase family protein, partial [Candidatus Dormibacterales bacterium]
GLAQAGTDLTTADLVIGTSAGSVVGAQILGGPSLEELYAVQLADATGEIAARIGARVIAQFLIGAAWPGDPRRGRAHIGRAAIRAHTVPESVRRKIIEDRLPSLSWPERRLIVMAVDAQTGEGRAFDRESGVPLPEAVAASCAVPIVWPPITIEGRQYVDGGVRSSTNADYAKGCDRVVVLAPTNLALRRSTRIANQLATLGAEVRSIVVSPDTRARQAIGSNVLDPAHRAASARAGRQQAADVAEAVAAVWA